MPVRAWGQAAAGLAMVVGATLAGAGTAYAADVPTLPASPKVGVPETGPAGLVRIPVSATAGTTVQEHDAPNVVAPAYAGGGVQSLALRPLPLCAHQFVLLGMDECHPVLDGLRE